MLVQKEIYLGRNKCNNLLGLNYMFASDSLVNEIIHYESFYLVL